MLSLKISLPKLIEMISKCEVWNVFNANKCGLLLKRAPDRTIAQQWLSWTKKSKGQDTVLVWANAGKTDRFGLTFIKNAWQLGRFTKITAVIIVLTVMSTRMNIWNNTFLRVDKAFRFELQWIWLNCYFVSGQLLCPFITGNQNKTYKILSFSYSQIPLSNRSHAMLELLRL